MSKFSVKLTLYAVFTWLLGFCYGFVVISSATGQDGNLKDLFKNDESFVYNYVSRIVMSERDANEGKSVGFQIKGVVRIDTVWSDGDRKLLKIQMKFSKLNVRSRESQIPNDFDVNHDSKLDTMNNEPFLVEWNNGEINSIYVQKNETVTMLNLKRGISSLLQFQLNQNEERTETDASGVCKTKYEWKSGNKLLKLKYSCTNNDFKDIKDPDEILGSKLQSSRQTYIELNNDFTRLNSVKSEEFHVVYLSSKNEIGAELKSVQELTFVDKEYDKIDYDRRFEDVVKGFIKKDILTEIVEVNKENAKFEFPKLVTNVRDYLKSNLGSLKPTRAFLKLINVAKTATKEDVIKTLQYKKNKDILLPLLDVLGYVQTEDSHEAVMKVLHFDREDQIDSNERYLWALSFSSHPNPEIVKDLLKKLKKTANIPDKVKETLLLTLASMSRKITRSGSNSRIVRDVEEEILNGLDYAKKEQKHQYLRALKNLQSPSTIPILLNYIKKGTGKETVLAWKAIRAFPKEYIDKDVLKAAEKTLFQLERKQDSSSRVLAVDILLEYQINDNLLKNLLEFVATNDTTYEIRQFTLQKINMLASNCEQFDKKVQDIIRKDPKINNYIGLSPRGLSTALSRRFLTSLSSNGSLVSYQDVLSGIVKMGMVNILMEKGTVTKELFSLGIFTGGLNSLVSSNEENDGVEDDEEESATAGMELAIFDTQIRPFVFFTGQGELMGHVWSGTASEKTSAFQVLALIQDHSEHVRLGSGFVAVHRLKGVGSFDLSGQVEISLWNRNSESLIQNSAGVFFNGMLGVNTEFVEVQVDFNKNLEVQLNLQSDVDFSSGMRACLRLTQPDTSLRYNIFKIERIPGTKYNVSLTRKKKSYIPGITYAINKKNNEMCRLIFG